MLIESGVEMAGKSGEFCRMNTVCTYTANFKRVDHSNNLQNEISFKYEIVVDKTMWAVCGRGSGTFMLYIILFNKLNYWSMNLLSLYIH